MLKSLEFENFKSWGGRHRLEFGRITGLFGANSSGKSSIIHLLLLLKQTVESPDSTLVLNFGGSPSEYVDFGSFRDIVTNHNLEKNISYQIDWDAVSRPMSHPALRMENVVLSSDLKAIRRRRGEEAVVDNLKYSVNLKKLERDSFMQRYFSGLPESLFINALRGPRGGYTIEATFRSGEEEQTFRTKRSLRAYGPIGLHRLSPRAIHQMVKEIRNNYNSRGVGISDYFYWEIEQIIRQIESYATQWLRSVVYLGPLRDYPHRNYPWTGAIPATVGHRGEEAIQVLLAGASQRPSAKRPVDIESQRSATIEAVTHWLRRLGIAESLSFEQVGRGARIWEARLHQQGGESPINLADVGFGVSQVLPVIVTLLAAPPGSLVVLEHPGIHLHPRTQSELADLLVEIAKTGEIQILVESHSEHLLARIQRRIAEATRVGGSLKPDDVRLYFCEQEQGKSKLTPLEMQASGVITNWPDDFFGDILEERMALSGFYPEADDPA